jgi:hypothetical protein
VNHCDECPDCFTRVRPWSGRCAPCNASREEQGRAFERNYDEARNLESEAMDAGIDPADTERFTQWASLR